MSNIDSNIPLPKSSSNATVSVKVLNICSPRTRLPTGAFLHPVKPGLEKMWLPDYAFFIEHHATQASAGTNTKPESRKVLFDLGPMKDPSKLPPVMQGMLAHGGFDLSVDKDVVEQLEAGGVSVDEIESVIWSHSHYDHIGDMSLFPSKTKLIIGQGTDRKTYPTTPDAPLRESDFAGREVVELDFSKADLSIGNIPALDHFGDGSLYLLNTPGHWPGHITALARVKPNSFVLLGGDTCHHPGQIRPNPHLHRHFPCPGGILADSMKPILTLPEGFSMYADRPTALASMEKVTLLDAHPDVFMVTTHDPSLGGIIQLFPESLDDWKEKGWKEKAAYAFLEEGNKAYGFH